MLALHRDPAVWGEDVAVFNPDRFSREGEAELPPNAYKPFGNGLRACIGRQFALQEATLALGLILHRFELTDHRNYTLEVSESLTIKPDLFVRVQPRTVDDCAAPRRPQSKTRRRAPSRAPRRRGRRHGHDTPLLVLFGSNMGTAEGIARQVAEAGQALGFRRSGRLAGRLRDRLPTGGAVLIVGASYNGTPPDNAVKFCNWLSDAPADALKGVSLRAVWLRQPRLGRHLSGGAQADRRRAWKRWAPSA